MPPYHHLFFDLDKTIYDFDASSRLTFEEIHRHFRLAEKGITDLESFIEKYTRINLTLWELYRGGGIRKEILNVSRFDKALKEFGVDDPILAEAIASYYVTESPLKNTLFPGVERTLTYLKKKYRLYIITNGFEEVQHKKLNINKLRPFFDDMITSEEAGCKKPDPAIFHYALKRTGALLEESLMIGDDLTVDIQGAREAGMDQVFVNYDRSDHQEAVTFEVFSFSELCSIL
ncbi:MAG: YjjG family noncanonical pyrimidine nucleotidase [Bacteroidales bacterium]|nr:YjjG family noncanonical pyrimidine nucleotidase [Lentimicrobiaceae bacterium]MDD5695761.1 YjjG family noncanonical pyrimidine nucleotidase [Bacteroidales bacterium]